MLEKILYPATVVMTIVGMFAQLTGVPYRLRLLIVAVLLAATAGRLILRLTEFVKSGPGVPPRPKPPIMSVLKRGVWILVVSAIASLALVVVDQFHSIRVRRTAGDSPGAGRVEITAPFPAADVAIICSVAPSAVLVTAPIGADQPDDQPNLVIGPATDSSANYTVNDFAAPQQVRLAYRTSPPHTAFRIEVTTSSTGLGVLYDDDVTQHHNAIFGMGGVLCVSGWALLYSRWRRLRS